MKGLIEKIIAPIIIIGATLFSPMKIKADTSYYIGIGAFDGFSIAMQKYYNPIFHFETGVILPIGVANNVRFSAGWTGGEGKLDLAGVEDKFGMGYLAAEYDYIIPTETVNFYFGAGFGLITAIEKVKAVLPDKVSYRTSTTTLSALSSMAHAGVSFDLNNGAYLYAEGASSTANAYTENGKVDLGGMSISVGAGLNL